MSQAITDGHKAYGVIVLFLVFVGTVLYFSMVLMLPRKKEKKTDWTEELDQAKSSSKDGRSTGPLKNIWNAAQESVGTSLGKKTQSSDKPFGSSYYYAHNNPKSKGGYADGLKTEDYQMNTPRLLSRGNKPENGDDKDLELENDTQRSSCARVAQTKKESVSLNGIRITKYLWDDPGDVDDGVATMRIETLPGQNGAKSVPWKDANITDASAKLVDGGLLVEVQSKTETYYLHLPTLYGKVDVVKPMVKTKRLLVKIYKKKDKSNLEAWPHPYR